jgi:hypothetical protein
MRLDNSQNHCLFIKPSTTLVEGRDNGVCIATGYGLDDLGVGVLVPVR